jgi:hypothetical protein
MTADYARKLVNEYSPLKYKKLKDVLEYIQLQALHGFSSAFIDGEVEKSEKISKISKTKRLQGLLGWKSKRNLFNSGVVICLFVKYQENNLNRARNLSD